MIVKLFKFFVFFIKKYLCRRVKASVMLEYLIVIVIGVSIMVFMAPKLHKIIYSLKIDNFEKQVQESIEIFNK